MMTPVKPAPVETLNSALDGHFEMAAFLGFNFKADAALKDGLGGAPCKGGVFQWVRIPPGNYRSSRKQSEQSWR